MDSIQFAKFIIDDFIHQRDYNHKDVGTETSLGKIVCFRWGDRVYECENGLIVEEDFVEGRY